MNKENIGGRAYANGIKLISKNFSVKAYYNKNNKLNFKVSQVKNNRLIELLQKIPVIRGIVSLLFAIFIFLKEGVNSPKKYWFVFLIIFIDLLYFFILESGTGSIFVSNLILLSYYLIPLLLLFIFRKKIKTVLKYHGAEHKAVHYYENDCQGNINNYSRLHRRCGSNIIFYYIIINLIGNLFNINLNLNILFQQFIYLGIAYEAIKYTPEKLLFIPQIFQRLVTREPDPKHLKAAQTALNILYKKMK